jgi:hypothetical protein
LQLQSALNVQRTPQDSLGHESTQLNDMQVIFKYLAYECCWFGVSGGVSVTIPTAPDTNVRVTDFVGDSQFNNIDVERVRNFHIKNETWGLSPFLAALAVPCPNFFVQGFTQVDIPLTPSTVTFDESFPVQRTPQLTLGTPGALFLLPPSSLPPGTLSAIPPFHSAFQIREQYLLHADVGTGYWFVHNPANKLLTGLAGILEIHYTTTLSSANIVTMPSDRVAQYVTQPQMNGQTFFALAPAPPPQVGNQRDRLDIIDLTIGSTFEFANQATLAAGFVVPLSNGNNRIFDWEFELQLNWRFGYCGKDYCGWNAFSTQ